MLNKYTYVGATAEEDDIIRIRGVRETVKEPSMDPIANDLSSDSTNTTMETLGSSAGRRQTTER